MPNGNAKPLQADMALANRSLTICSPQRRFSFTLTSENLGGGGGLARSIAATAAPVVAAVAVAPVTDFEVTETIVPPTAPENPATAAMTTPLT